MQGRFKKEGSATRETGSAAPDGSGPSAGSGDDAFADATDGAGSGSPGVEAEGSGAEEAAGPGSRMALRNWRISTRLVSLIALPVVAATALGVVRVQDIRQDIEQLENLQLLTDMTHQATRLASALQEERDRSVGPLLSGEGAKSGNIPQLRERTDEARGAFADAALGIDESEEDLSGISNRVLDIGRQLNQLQTIREEAYEDPDYMSQTVSRYNDLISALLDLSQDMALATDNSDMIDATRALAAFSSAKEYASIQRAMISGGSARLTEDDTGFSASDWRFGKNAQENEQAAMRSFDRLFGETDVTDPLDGGLSNVVSARQLSDRVFDAPDALDNEGLSYQDAYDLMRSKIDAMDGIEQILLDEMESQASSLRSDAQRDALLNLALVVLVLGVSLVGAFVVARSMVSTLRRLQDTAQDVARRRLPEVVKQMSEADPQDVSTHVDSVGVNSRDEIGKVAQAFDDVHREAVRLAGEQALLRGNVNAMFTNLSRRSQGLIQRQLSLISELESREADPDQLASLFKLDHLATRMRRNGENLLVLAGEEPGRRWTRPVPLVDVLRAAASEVEQYERIELSAVPKTDVTGRVVNDLVHLLAELLENATSFSSPQTKVKVTGHALPDGRILVEIHDTGIGLSPEDLAEINDRLANPPTVDVSVSRRMGLFVVGRLSLRHGIRIQLRPSDSGGTTALVMLPADVAQNGPRPSAQARPDGLPERRPGASGPSATLSRDTGAAGRDGTAGQGGRNRMAGPSDRPALLGRPDEPTRPPRPGGPGRGPEPWDAVPGADPARGARPSWADRSGDTAPLPPVTEEPTEATGPSTGPSAPSGTDRGPAAPGPTGHDSPAAPYPGGAHPPIPRRFAGPGGTPPPAGPHGGPADAFPLGGGLTPRDQTTDRGAGAPPDRGAAPGPGDTARLPAVPGGEIPPGGPPPAQLPGPVPPQGSAPDPLWSPPVGQRPPHAGPGESTEAQPGPWHTGSDAGPGAAPADAAQLPGTVAGASGEGYGTGHERTPIFEQIESTWFGTRAISPPPEQDEPADETRPDEAPARPADVTDTGAFAPFGERAPAPPAGGTPAGGTPTRATPADGGAAPGTPAPQPQWRESPNDERWRQAEQVRSPAAGGVTTSGLPRRVPRANLVAGTAEEHDSAPDPGTQVSRAPDDVRGRLTNLRRGIQQGRRAGSSTGGQDGTGQGFSSSYPQER